MWKLIGNYAFNPEYENVVLIDGAKLVKRGFISWVKCIKMDPNSRLDTCVNETIAPSKVVTGVVPATTSPTAKLEQENALQNEKE